MCLLWCQMSPKHQQPQKKKPQDCCMCLLYVEQNNPGPRMCLLYVEHEQPRTPHVQ